MGERQNLDGGTLTLNVGRSPPRLPYDLGTAVTNCKKVVVLGGIRT